MCDDRKEKDTPATPEKDASSSKNFVKPIPEGTGHIENVVIQGRRAPRQRASQVQDSRQDGPSKHKMETAPKPDSNKIQLTNDSATKEKSVDSDYLNWDPLETHSKSHINLNISNAEDLLLGVTDFKGALCPHADSSGSCYKGSRCPHRYHIDQRKIARNPKLAVPDVNNAVTHYSKLPTQLLGREGMVFSGQVTCVISPSEFFVVPRQKFACLCSPETTEGLDSKDQKDQLEELTTELENYYRIHTFKNDVTYLELELLVAKHVFRGKQCYFRAVVTETTIIENEEDATVSCYLMDIGIQLTTDFFNVSPMPILFCHLPPLAYKCSIVGVSPLYLSYPTEITDKFMDAVNAPNVLVIMYRPFSPEEDGRRVYPFMGRPNEVDLMVDRFQDDSSDFISVHEILAETKEVLVWNKHLWRVPEIYKNHTLGQVDLLISKDEKAREKIEEGSHRKAEASAYAELLEEIEKIELEGDSSAEDEKR